MKAVIYCRVSTKGQAEDELPIDSQEEECRAYAKEKGWEIVKVYQDAGYSGGTIDRPAFQEMYITAKDNKPQPFEIILTWRSNRLFRDVEARLAYSRLFRRMGIRVISLHEPEYGEGATGRLTETIFGAIDEYYRAQVSEDTLRGLKMVAKQGYSTGGTPPTGYLNVRVPTGRIKPSGEPEMRTSWEQDPVKGPKVTRAYEMCAEGKTNVEIVRSTGIVSAKNGLSNLLHNRAYLGERIYNTTRRASLSDKKTYRIKNNPDSVIRVPNSHKPLVTQELFDRVQAILKSKRPKQGQRKNSRQSYLLTGLLWCKEHDCNYAGHTTGESYYYACATRKKLGKKLAPCLWLKKDAIENFILNNLKSEIFTYDRIKQGLEYLQLEQAKNRHEDDTEKREITAKLSQADIELSRFQESIRRGVYAEVFEDAINELHERKKRLNSELVELEKQRERELKVPVITESMVDEVLKRVNDIFQLTEPQELKAALSRFIERIEIHGQEVSISYTFAEPVSANVSTTGDPGGI